MTMKDIAKEIDCKHIEEKSSWYVFPYELNCWFVCRLTGQATDEKTCGKCKDRVPRRSKNRKGEA